MPSGIKFDAGKERFDLLPAAPLFSVAKVFTYGADKYGDRNWENGLSWGRLFAASLRHLFSWSLGASHDHESGIPHLSHAIANLLMLLEFEYTHPELDDRRAKK